MGKRLETLRRSESRDSLDSLSSRDSVQTVAACGGGDKRQQQQQQQSAAWPPGQPSSPDGDPAACKSSTLKSFFTRIGSTGMLSYSRLYSNSFREKLKQSRKLDADRQQLYRSVSASHLTASSSYMKGDDPADCLDHRRGGDPLRTDRGQPSSLESSPAEPGYVPLKTRSCDNISKLGTAKKPNFPYAFLRSRLSVLPEENGGGGGAGSGPSAAAAAAQLQQRDRQHRQRHEIVVTEELFREMDGDRECCRRVFSNLSSSNESGYDSDGPRTLDGCAAPYQNRKSCTDEDSGFGDTKSLAADSLNEFAAEEQHSEPTPRRHQHSDKDYNVPSMCLFYKRNRELNDRIMRLSSSDERSAGDAGTTATASASPAPNFHRRMFVKNRSSPAHAVSATTDLSSLPVDLNGLRSRMQTVRLLKSQYDDDIGVYLKMVVKHVANYNETRFFVMKLEPGRVAHR